MTSSQINNSYVLITLVSYLLLVSVCSEANGQRQVQETSIQQIRTSVFQLNQRINSIESNLLSRLMNQGCPSGFEYIPSVNGCYKLLQQNLNWSSAARGCRSLHEDAHLVVINDAAEQAAILGFVGRQSLAGCAVANFKDWGVHLYTAGQRVDPSQETPFVWKIVLDNDGLRIQTSHVAYTNWLENEPNFTFHRAVDTMQEACLQMIVGKNMQWNDGRCDLSFCSLCEVDI